MALPAGEVNFLAAREEGLGDYRQCPLVTSMEVFDSQRMAREAALAALDTLLGAAAAAPEQEQVSLSKRNFLRGKFFARGGNGTGR